MHCPFDAPPPRPPPTPKLTATLQSGDEESARLTSTHPNPKAPLLRPTTLCASQLARPRLASSQKRRGRNSNLLEGGSRCVSAGRRGCQHPLRVEIRSRPRGMSGSVPARGPSLPVRVQAAPSLPSPRAHVLGGRTRSARWSAGLAGRP